MDTGLNIGVLFMTDGSPGRVLLEDGKLVAELWDGSEWFRPKGFGPGEVFNSWPLLPSEADRFRLPESDRVFRSDVLDR